MLTGFGLSCRLRSLEFNDKELYSKILKLLKHGKLKCNDFDIIQRIFCMQFWGEKRQREFRILPTWSFVHFFSPIFHYYYWHIIHNEV